MEYFVVLGSNSKYKINIHKDIPMQCINNKLTKKRQTSMQKNFKYFL